MFIECSWRWVGASTLPSTSRISAPRPSPMPPLLSGSATATSVNDRSAPCAHRPAAAVAAAPATLTSHGPLRRTYLDLVCQQVVESLAPPDEPGVPVADEDCCGARYDVVVRGHRQRV